MPRLMAVLGLTFLTLVACTGDDASTQQGSRPSAVTTTTPTAGATSRPLATPEATSISDAEAEEIQQWAMTVCEAVSSFGDAMLSLIDDVEAATLPFEDRKERAIRINTVVWESARSTADTLADITPPGGAGEFHAALTDQMIRVAELAGRQDTELRDAQGIEDIERTNIEAEQLLIETDQQVGITGSRLEQKFAEAALAIAQCRF
ncbi:MAG: hypothetical protein DWG82_02590 [Chloroflexi bacterium]|nr:hypothetical protein [Chloroflexota bacterium]MQC48070.1 hypothetical protein [Chloroflexota bacterium]